MLILALEGALARCSAAILRDENLSAEAVHEAPRGHPAALPALAERILMQANITPTALDAIAVSVGPGGFTGLRTAIALAEGMAQALDKPLIGVTTGEALAAEILAEKRQAGAVWSALDQRQGRVVLEIFSPGAALPQAPVILPIETLPDPEGVITLIGDAAVAVSQALAARGFVGVDSLPALPSAKAVGLVAMARLKGLLPPRGAAPLYAEPPATTTPRPLLS